MLAGPITVFVGLGSPADVLTHTTKRILKALNGGQTGVYIVDPTAYIDSHFASELNIPPESYLCMGWGRFMRALSQRVVEEHRADIERVCDELIEHNDVAEENVSALSHRLAEMGLIRLGRLRAAWMLRDGSYLPHDREVTLHLFGDLILCIRMLERRSGRQAAFGDDGLVEFSHENHVTRVMVCSGVVGEHVLG